MADEQKKMTDGAAARRQIKNGSDIKNIQGYATSKACSRFATYIAESVKEPLQQAVSESKVLSIVFDGATDSSISEVELVYCRILDKGYPRDILVGLEDLQHAHADGVFDAIGRAMQSFAGENWLDKLWLQGLMVHLSTLVPMTVCGQGYNRAVIILLPSTVWHTALS
ncbi:uncharacterized protein [Ptychodera flava]|uniref:uncharacterized protein n=1 Tax=Ptychodera flava TaxID=63121 RepID=UPI00396A73EA